MVGGLATLGFVPLRPRERIDLVSLVVWFALYKVGIFALVTVQPRATRAIFLGALGIDLLLVFVLVLLTGGGGSLFYLLFFPLVAVNAYYFGPWVAFVAALIAGGLMAAAASLAPPWIGWTGVTLLVVLFGLPAVTVGIVADRERRARGEVEGLLNRLQAAQEELAAFVRPVADRQGLVMTVETDPAIPTMEIDRVLLRQAIHNLIKNGQEALSRGGALTISSRALGDGVEIAVADTGPGIAPEVGDRLFEQFFTTKPQGTGLGLSISRQIIEEHGGELRWANRPGGGAVFTIRLPVKVTHA